MVRVLATPPPALTADERPPSRKGEEFLETTCTIPGCPNMVSGDPTNRRDETPFFSAESTTPGEADHVTDVLGPRNDCAGGADLLRESTEHQPEPPGPIIEPRASHMLLAERTRSNVLPTDYENPTQHNPRTDA